MIVLPAPVPMSLMSLPDHDTELHVPDPAPTLIVSPLWALAMQLCTLAWSIVEVQLGVEPVQAAKDGMQNIAQSKNIRLEFLQNPANM